MGVLKETNEHWELLFKKDGEKDGEKDEDKATKNNICL